MTVGPAARVIGRIDGPAASLDTCENRTVAAFAISTDGQTGVAAIDLATPGAAPTTLTGPSTHRRHPPVVLAGSGDTATIAWWETARAGAGRIAWTEGDASGAPYPAPRELPAEFGSNPRGAGRPPAVIAVEGRPAGRHSTGQERLGVWQRAPGTRAGWKRVGRTTTSAPIGFVALGTGEGTAVVGSWNPPRVFALSPHGRGTDGPVTSLPGRPAGPTPLWLGRASGAILAGWSEWVPGPTGAIAVRLSRSTDGGASWAPPRTLLERQDGLHPLAHFAVDGTSVAATWRTAKSGAERIVLATSTDAGNSFSPPQELDSGRPGTERTRPRVAIAGNRVLAAWQEREGAALAIHASLSRDLGSTLAVRAARVAEAAVGRAIRNPAPWLLGGGRGGILWESTEDLPPGGRPDPTTGPELVTLHHRTLRR
ncbi:MAG: hypothetical protein P8R42_04235 [Candidatus Binatia bacterium]|nr:hypothetical protein [Candidatus Binatia bacterium]